MTQRNPLLRLLAGGLLSAGVALFMPAASALTTLPWENTRSFQEVLTHDGVVRYVSYIRPVNTQPNAPALVVLPYNNGNAPAMANLTEIGQLARDFGVWVIIPVAIDGQWAHNPVRPGMPDDVGFLTQVIDHSVSAYGIDPKRIYMTGYSAGGNMSMRYACERPDKIAGAANVAATMRESLAKRCEHSLPMPIAHMHGTLDDQVPYDHGNFEYNDLLLRGALTARQVSEFWAEANHCGAAPEKKDLPDLVDDQTTVFTETYSGCDDGVMVRLYTVVNGGHNWPGTLDFIPRVGLVTQDMSATRELWNFFSQYSRK